MNLFYKRDRLCVCIGDYQLALEAKTLHLEDCEICRCNGSSDQEHSAHTTECFCVTQRKRYLRLKDFPKDRSLLTAVIFLLLSSLQYANNTMLSSREYAPTEMWSNSNEAKCKPERSPYVVLYCILYTFACTE